VQFERDKVKKAISELAGKGVLIGTSSWKYPGWRGLLYDDARYVWHGRFSESRFERLCLAEYAEVFKTVSVDAAYYRFPDEQFWERLVADAPAEFLFSLKVTDEITVKTFPNLPRFGSRAGKVKRALSSSAPGFSSSRAVNTKMRSSFSVLMTASRGLILRDAWPRPN